MIGAEPCCISEVADQCFRELEQELADGGQLTDTHLTRLALLLGRNWIKALQVVDENAAQCFTGQPSGRHVYQVHGKSGQHLTLPAQYCSCQAYFYEVIGKSEAVYCKHQLAARLACLLNRCPVTVVSDTTLASIMMQS